MAQTLINNCNTESNNNLGDASPFRKIEFHPARKPFTGFTNSGGYSDFRLETLNPTTTSSISNQTGGGSGLIGKKRDGSKFLESGLDPELSFGITFRRIGAGLENLGNTCFLNSVLQCLTYTEPLAAYLQSGKHQSSCRNAGFCALCAIQKHVSRALQSTGRSLAPKDLVSNLRCISRTFRNSRQEDAHEYMVNLLESMHKCCLPSGVPSESPSAYEKSLVHKIFGGRLRSQVKCMQCSFCSNKFDPFLDLSLEIVKAESLYKAFANFTAKEQLDGGEKQYQCQQCKQKVRALKQLTIHKAPYVLTVHLKRFGSHISGQKIDKKVQFGPTLDLKPFVTGPYDGDLKYTLYGVLVHAGWSTHSGHYYCFVRTSSGMWYSLDDNRVVQVSEKKVFEQKAYMLFYFRDRKNIPLKKPVDIVQKEKIVINGMGQNNTCANINEQMRETVQRSAIENKLNGSNPSLTVPLGDASSASASKDTIRKEKPVQESSCLTRYSALSRESRLEGSPKGQQQNDLVKVPSILHQTGEPCLPQSDSPVVGSSDTIKLNDVINMPPAAKIVQCSVGCSTNKDLGYFATRPSSCNGVQNSVTMKDRNESVLKFPSCKENRSTNGDLSDSTSVPTNYSIPPTNPADTTSNTEKTCSGEMGNIASSPDSKKTTMEKIDPVMPVSQTNGEDPLIEDVSKAVAGGESLGGIARNDGQKTEATVSAELNNLQKIRSSLLQEKALDHKRCKKLQKKFLKCKVISMNVGSNILIGSSLSLWKKKKRKRSKKSALRVKNLTPEELMDSIQIDQGTSSSEKVKEMTLGSGKNKSSSRSEDRASVIESVGAGFSGDMAVNPVDKELKDRIDKHGDVLATSSQLGKHCNSVIAGSQSDSKGPNGLQNGRSQSELVKMLTRGLLETNVPRWDDKESSPFQITESRGVEKISIGYVADEWDEEYDLGKRKKVRNPVDRFDGQNPFQEFATKKAKLNKSKLNQSSSGNRPFRT